MSCILNSQLPLRMLLPHCYPQINASKWDCNCTNPSESMKLLPRILSQHWGGNTAQGTNSLEKKMLSDTSWMLQDRQQQSLQTANKEIPMLPKIHFHSQQQGFREGFTSGKSVHLQELEQLPPG